MEIPEFLCGYMSISLPGDHRNKVGISNFRDGEKIPAIGRGYQNSGDFRGYESEQNRKIPERTGEWGNSGSSGEQEFRRVRQHIKSLGI